MTARHHKAAPGSGRPLLLTCWIAFQCQEKPTYEPPAVLGGHAAVVVEVLLQVGERTLNLVIGVGHPLTILTLIGEKIREVEVDAVHGRPQPPVAEARLAVLQHRTLVERVLPFGFPRFVFRSKAFPVSRGQPLHQVVQRSCRQQLGILRDVTPDNLHHVELAHLYPVGGEHAEQALQTVNDDARYPVSAAFYAGHGCLIVRQSLMPDELEVEDVPRPAVQADHDPAVAAPVRRIKMYEARTRYVRLSPANRYVAQPALDGGRTRPEHHRQFRRRLLVFLIEAPYLAV